ncbi:hypothetical protein [Hydrogenophaga sp.]|uniref:hypothetical protein n=1 Tax=Hydrogenophaga sp. TaxID=1904254 RepID=UPI003F6C1CE9
MKQEKLARDKPDFSALTGRVFQADAVKAVRAAGAPVVTLSNNASDGFIQPLGDHARGVIVTQVLPNERSVAFPLIKEAQDLAKAKGLDGVLPAMMEGFDAAKVLRQGAVRRSAARGAQPDPGGTARRAGKHAQLQHWGPVDQRQPHQPHRSGFRRPVYRWRLGAVSALKR